MGATRRSSSASTAMPESEAARLDRLRRNRISAAKCRVKRKAAAAQVEERVLALEHVNTRLLRENERLTKLLEAAGISAIKPPEPLVTSSDGLRLHKRSKHEHKNRVNHSFDSSESAAFASSPQRNILLAVVTTVLFSNFQRQQSKSTRPRAPAATATCSPNYKALATRIIHCLRTAAALPCGPSSKVRGKLPESTRDRGRRPPTRLTSSASETSSRTSGGAPARMCAGATSMCDSSHH